MKMQFESGEGKHFEGGVNFLWGENATYGYYAYAEVSVPEGASDDYGYLAMKAALMARIPDRILAVMEWPYDGQEQFLDASTPVGKIYTEVEL